MPTSFRLAAAAALVLLAAPLAILQPPSSADTGQQQTAATSSVAGEGQTVLHRVVWDQWRRGRKGYHLRSAKVDGTDVRKVYDSRRGFTLDLSLDPAGRWVAFSPCCLERFPTMVVARVRGGTVLEPLAGHPRIYFVGGIGWSPDGRRIAFEGAVGTTGDIRSYLWTVRPDGTRLRRLVEIGDPRRTIINDALAWTPDGILYSDGRNLRAAESGQTRLVLRRVREFRLSGDGQQLLTIRHRDNGSSAWISKPDGTEGRRIFTQPHPGEGTTYDTVTPNFSGSSLLAERSTVNEDGEFDEVDVVTWATDADPATAVPLPHEGIGYVVTWN